MSAPIPKGKWSWKHDKCLACETTKIKHKGNGLCLHCFDKKRAENPKRKQQLKNQLLKWWLKVRETEKYKKYQNDNAKNWNKKNPLLHKRNFQKRNLKQKMKKFIFNGGRMKKGLVINIDGKLVKTNVRPPKNVDSDNDTTIRELEMFKKVYAEL